ncbi:hypothetical protein DL93DRAFT_107724 [Clavulina sp. PMI_390]|nr:hypothetical protein DL93DRAFT_107724 [Clavulina sp. PMI_390]
MGYRESIDYLTSSTIHNQFRVYVGSVLHKRLEKAHDDVLQRQSRYIEVSGLSVDREVSWILNQRGVFHLKGTQNSISESSLHPPPCLEVVISPFECKKADCTFDHSKDLTIQSIRSRLLMHLHGLIVMDKMHRFDWDTADVTPQFLKDTRRWWIHHIFKLVFPISYQLGNEQIIPSNNPNFPPRAFSTFHDWVTKFLEDLDVLNTPSLSDIIVAAILTYRWQPYTTPIFTDFAFLTERADRVDVNDLARFYTRRDSPIIAGLKFFRTIVTQRVQIDANTIVHFLEHVILAIILNERKGHKDEVAFHDLILPRSWILYSVRNKNIPATKSPAIDEVIAPVTGLLHMLHYWDGTATELLYEGRGSPRLAVKNALIFRTLRWVETHGVQVLIAQNW